MGMITHLRPTLKQKLEDRYGKITLKYLKNLNENEFKEIKKFIWGLNTLNIPWISSRKTSYKTPLIKELNYNASGLTQIIVKSGYEENYILFFEKNKIKWDYESVVIVTENNQLYNPDFKIIKDNEEWLIEVKGTFFRQGPDYIKKKLMSAVDYCDEREWNFCLTTTPVPKNWNFLKKTTKEDLECLISNI
jgi:predicted nuclease of restriction endonuclease-like RecB superfamily